MEAATTEQALRQEAIRRRLAGEQLIRCCTKNVPFSSLLPASMVWR